MSLGPFRAEILLGVEHVVIRSVRDAAGSSMPPAAPVSATPSSPLHRARPYQAEVGADPGRLRIGLLTTSSGCPCILRSAGGRPGGAQLATLGHHVEEADPAGLEDEDLVTPFAALWDGPDAPRGAVDRAWPAGPRPDDVEPLT